MDGSTIFLLVLLILIIVIVIILIILNIAGVWNGNNIFNTKSPFMVVTHNRDDSGHNATSLVLMCMDYRFVSETIQYLNKHRENDFDQLVLAGASLGYNESIEAYSGKEIPKDTTNNWHLTYEDHVRLAIKLHHITEIIVVDHMDCGHYRSVYGESVDTPKKEKAKHKFNLHKFVRLMKSKEEFKDLDYMLLLAEKHEDGNVSFKKIKE